MNENNDFDLLENEASEQEWFEDEEFKKAPFSSTLIEFPEDSIATVIKLNWDCDDPSNELAIYFNILSRFDLVTVDTDFEETIYLSDKESMKFLEEVEEGERTSPLENFCALILHNIYEQSGIV